MHQHFNQSVSNPKLHTPAGCPSSDSGEFSSVVPSGRDILVPPSSPRSSSPPIKKQEKDNTFLIQLHIDNHHAMSTYYNSNNILSSS